MKGFMKVLIVLVIVGILGFVVYSALPEYPHNKIRSYGQKQFQPETQVKIQETQALVNPSLDADYKTILESHTNSKVWVYDKDSTAGTEQVTFYGTGAVIDLKEVMAEDGAFYSDAKVKVVFLTDAEGKLSVDVYLNGEDTPVDKNIKSVIFTQLLNGN